MRVRIRGGAALCPGVQESKMSDEPVGGAANLHQRSQRSIEQVVGKSEKMRESIAPNEPNDPGLNAHDCEQKSDRRCQYGR